MAQKVIKVGKSLAVTLPKRHAEEVGLKAGDPVGVFFDRRQKVFIVEPGAVVDSELVEWTDKFINEYRPALKELADK